LKWNILIIFIIFLVSFFIVGYFYESSIDSIKRKVDILESKLSAWETKYFQFQKELMLIEEEVLILKFRDR
jgi:hypothetical protein